MNARAGPALRTLAVAALAFIEAAPAPADELPALPSLRHLVFSVNVSLVQQVETPLESLTTSVGEGRMSRTVMATGESSRSRSRRTADGTVTVDVVAATADAGLVCDVREDAVDRRASVVRVGVASNGRLQYPPDATLNEEERTILRLLGRGLVGPAPRAQGATWDVDDASGDYRNSTTFRVVDATPSESRLEYDSSTRFGGPSGFDATTHGRVGYDQTRLVPLHGTEQTHSRASTSAGERTIDIGVDYTLLEDSFASH